MNANYSEALEQQVRLLRFAREQRFSLLEENLLADADLEIDVSQTAIAERITTVVLDQADTFYWGAAMCPLLTAAAALLKDWRLSQDDLPTNAGFVWLAQGEQVIGNDPNPDLRHRVRAFAWAKISDDEIITMDCVEASPGLLVPGIWAKWSFGESLREAARKFTGSDGDILHATGLLRYVAAAYGLLAQRIVSMRHAQVERHARKRLEREGWDHESLVRVVELRRREHVGKQPVEPVEHEWSCQWVVRGHWRQQPYPKAGAVRPKWITPYVKGPEDKPLKPPRATVFAVVR